ncbi:MAG: NAD(P)-dependent oxidoreductase [Acidaminococcaceae bacterium]|nr:NAD(P)-dependent oxidoreductase [Acidaminococcaceae bacterium]
MKTAVITGATGTIGRALIDVCIEAGYEVMAIVHRNSLRVLDLENIEHCHVLNLNLAEYNNALEEIQKQNIVLGDYAFFFHLAWMAPFGKDRENLPLQLQNVQDSLAAVHFAKALGCSVFIGAGSQAEYGRVEGKLAPDTPTFPETGYGIAKLSAGQMTRLACEQVGLKHIWTRILSVYGPYDREQTLISTAINDMMNNKETSFTPCNQIWDYIYSKDASRAMLLAAQKGKHGDVYVIGSGEAHPLKEYIQKIAEITGYKKEIGFGKRLYNEKQVMYLQADIKQLQEIGFEVKVPFEDGIKRIIAMKKQ